MNNIDSRRGEKNKVRETDRQGEVWGGGSTLEQLRDRYMHRLTAEVNNSMLLVYTSSALHHVTA